MADATASDVDVSDIVINGAKLKANVTAAITATMLTQTITGASTIRLDLHDPDRTILTSNLCVDRTTLKLDDLTFELAQITKADNIVSLTFEDLAVATLRRKHDVVKAAAGTTSRAAFCRRIIAQDASWIVVDGPNTGETILEEIAVGGFPGNYAYAGTDGVPAADSAPTKDPSTGKTQVSADQVAQYAYAAGFRGQGLIDAIAVAHAESGFDASQISPPDSDGSVDQGLWQINSKAHPQYTQAEMLDPTQNAAAAFTISNSGANFGGWSTYKRSSTHPYNNNAYAQYLPEAQVAADSVQPGASTSSSTSASTGTSAATAPDTTGEKPENHWAGIVRVMAEINWRVFARRGHIVIAPDSWLLKQPGITIEEFKNGVDSIDFDVDRGKKVSTVTVTCRAKRWTAFAGEPVKVTKLGPADDTYLLSTISRSLASTTANVNLAKRRKALPETAAASSDAGASGVGTQQDPVTIGKSSPDVQKMIDFALAQRGDTYVMGGNGPSEWDCSGLVLAATAAGGHSIGARTAEAQYEACVAAGTTITVQQALNTAGALLFGPGSDPDPSGYHIGHVAISLGNGQTMQAKGTAYGVGVFSASPASDWTYAALAPGYNYNAK